MNMRPISITTTRWVTDASIPAMHCIIRAHDIRRMRKKQRRMILNCSLVSRITIAAVKTCLWQTVHLTTMAPMSERETQTRSRNADQPLNPFLPAIMRCHPIAQIDAICAVLQGWMSNREAEQIRNQEGYRPNIRMSDTASVWWWHTQKSITISLDDQIGSNCTISARYQLHWLHITTHTRWDKDEW